MTKEMLMNKLKENMTECSAKAYLVSVLYPYLEAWEGKMVSKRLTTFITSSIGSEYSVYIRKGYNCMELTIRRGTRVLDCLNLCDIKEKKFSMLYFKEHNPYLFKYQESYNKYSNACVHVDDWYSRYLVIKEQIKDLKKDVEDSGCNYLIDWDFRFID